ncbi:hypothetical protein OG342_39425 [Streptomyces bobili]|uniref:hypothetical protein n=1 Tax=Streptomyces bobili TaxID=67280 RepID=UPI0022537C2C|nr:hypothetical protein [Streptomyces bobili]MCX5528851.1 hypothetical protein [Streptomyces bobili]
MSAENPGRAAPADRHGLPPRNPPVRLSDVHDRLGEYGYPLRRIPLTQWRAELRRSSEASGAPATTLAFFGSWDAGTDDATAPELRLGHVRTDNVVTGLHGSGIPCPSVDRDLFFRYLDHCVATGTLPAPAGKQGHLATPAQELHPPGTSGLHSPTTASEPVAS